MLGRTRSLGTTAIPDPTPRHDRCFSTRAIAVMRSRPYLAISLSHYAPLPGDTIEVEARFASSSNTPLDRVVFELVGIETALGKLSRIEMPIGKDEVCAPFERLAMLGEVPGCPLTPGTHTYSMRFELPHDLLPSYEGRHVAVRYMVTVRADIPWWPDRVGKCVVSVASITVDDRSEDLRDVPAREPDCGGQAAANSPMRRASGSQKPRTIRLFGMPASTRSLAMPSSVPSR